MGSQQIQRKKITNYKSIRVLAVEAMGGVEGTTNGFIHHTTLQFNALAIPKDRIKSVGMIFSSYNADCTIFYLYFA